MKHRALNIGFVLLFLSSLFISLFGSLHQAHAAPSPVPLGSNGIAVGLVLGGGDNPSSYNLAGSRFFNGQQQAIKFSYKKPSGGAQAFYSDTLQPAGGSCAKSANVKEYNQILVVATIGGKTAGSKPIDLCDKSDGNIYYYDMTVNGASSAGQFGTVKGSVHYSDAIVKNQPFKSTADGKLTASDGSTFANLNFDDNGNFHTINNVPAGKYTITANYTPVSTNAADSFNHAYSEVITVAAGKTTTVDGKVADTLGSSGSSTPSDTKPTCESSGFALSWIFCALINGLGDATDHMYKWFIQPMLQVQPVDTNTSDPNNKVFQIWSNFRIIANVVLIVALLVAVFGQAIGGGLIDAYTAKKMVPRILVAAIMINISYYAMALMVDLTNVAGKGIEALISAPLADSGNLKFSISGTSGTLGIAGTLAGIWAVAINLGAVVEFFLLFVLLPAFLAMLGVFITLLLRQGLIVFLVLISPVAFALYCLPNTEKYFRKWWEFFFKALLVYPIVASIFGVANVAAVAIQLGNNDSPQRNLLADFASIILPLLPLFLIPFAFKLAGGAIGNLYGLFDGWKQRGHEAVKGNANDPNSLRNRVRLKTRTGYAEKGIIGANVGNAVNPAFLFGKNGRNRRRAAMTAQKDATLQSLRQSSASQLMFEANKDDSDVMGDLAMFGSGAASRAAIDRDYSAGTGSFKRLTTKDEKDARRQQLLVASATADKIGRNSASRRAGIENAATIGYALSPGETGWNQAVGAMRDISGGDDAVFRKMVNEFQYQAKQVGRPDLSGNTDSDVYNGYRAWTSVGLYQHGNGKPSNITGAGDYFEGLVSRVGSGNMTKLDEDNFGAEAKQRGKTTRAVATEAAATFYTEQPQLSQSGSGAVRDEAYVQRERIARAMQSLPDQVITEVTGAPYDPSSGVPKIAIVSGTEAVREKARVYDTQRDRGGGRDAPPPEQG
ncbi:MAG: hypothetical protein JWS12_965 [Candidatus Saccharibacteria bacterium]|nr:hypothetical protein [Candidatus Saccharibacteria bacterium]